MAEAISGNMESIAKQVEKKMAIQNKKMVETIKFALFVESIKDKNSEKAVKEYRKKKYQEALKKVGGDEIKAIKLLLDAN